MTYHFGARSSKNLATCHPILQRVTRRVLALGVMDFAVIEGHRTVERQQELYNATPPKSQIDGIIKKGRHNFFPSMAEDLVPYPAVVNGVNVWDDRDRFCVLAGLMFACAAEDKEEHPYDWQGLKFRWGGDWDGDGNNADSKFDDLGHFELAEI